MISDFCHINLRFVKFNPCMFYFALINNYRTELYAAPQQVCILALCSFDQKKKKLAGPGGRLGCAAAPHLTLLLTLRKRPSVNQIRAAAQTSPGVRCYRASPTMLHCSLHIAYPPQRSGGFQWWNHEVRWSALCRKTTPRSFFMRLRRAFRVIPRRGYDEVRSFR